VFVVSLGALAVHFGCGPTHPPAIPDPFAELRVALGDLPLTDGIVAQLPDDAAVAVVVHMDHLTVARVGDDAVPPGAGENPLWRLELTAGAPAEEQLRGVMISPLYEVLQQRTDELKARAAADPERPFTGTTILVSAQEVPPETLRMVMYTAGQAQFHPFHFWSG